MRSPHQSRRSRARAAVRLTRLPLALGLLSAGACARATSTTAAAATATQMGNVSPLAPVPDRRVGLSPGLWDAGTATWNMRVLSTTRPSEKFLGSTNSDLAFLGNYAIQGNYNGFQVWDISDPSKPALKTAYYCPASQSDVSVYRNLLFVSAEGLGGRLDCGGQGVPDTVSNERIRGLRIFDISDIDHPKYVGNVQTCRGSHTHTLLVDPKDTANVYVYISGSFRVRSPNELAGCSTGMPDTNPSTALFRIEVIKVPLAHPEQAAIVSSPRIFNDLVAPPKHGQAAADREAAAEARARGAFTVSIGGEEMVAPDGFINPMLDSIVKARGGSGAPTAADSAALRTALPGIVAKMIGQPEGKGPQPGPTQCHDITVYPAIGLAGGACEGYGMLLDIHDPEHPVRVAAVSDSNFSYWHSATFNNDGTKVLFSDEWGGGGQPKCRATDPREWGADAIFTVADDHQLHFQGYYKLPAPQTPQENCVAHNGSLVPVPGRDVMVQAWYQGGVSVFDFTNAAHPTEIAYFDRGPANGERMAMGGSWSAYWYNGAIVSSEIARGLDIFELTPSPLLTQNEIDAAKTAHLDYLNVQGQPHYTWPATFVLARAYVDQLARSNGLEAARLTAIRDELSHAESVQDAQGLQSLQQLATELDRDATISSDGAKVKLLASTVRDLAHTTR